MAMSSPGYPAFLYFMVGGVMSSYLSAATKGV